MRTKTDFPVETKLLDPVWIEMPDGVRLAAKIWLPVDATEAPVPAILEYLPYRRNDGTSARDALTHPYFAGHGYASIRVDMRGSGDSEGVLRGEYLRQEQDDALVVIDWITQQPWCSGAVGMIGISWGGFNGLQVAARQPEALKAIVTICSTDDRYADDIHYMGGCMLVDNPWWNAYMFSLNTTPPDPAMVGNRWKEIWEERLEKTGFWLEEWLQHQRRDAFWQHGSVCEDYAAIKAAVYAVGGWADGYSNAVFRLLAGLEAPVKGLVGPWAHKYPHFAKPGPQIGFLQECLRWWDYWLKGIETGIMDEPALRAYVQDPAPPLPFYEERAGRWVTEDSWPVADRAPRKMYLNADGLSETAGETVSLPISSPMSVGSFGGHWCAFGLDPDGPGDQRGEAGGSLVFETPVIEDGFDILGAPVVELELSSDAPVAMIAAVLSDVQPDGAATRVSYGLLNLTHRDSHAAPQPMEPGKRIRVRLQLNDCGQHFAPGHRLRLALSTAYWPIAWPAPEAATLMITTGQSRLVLPVRPASDADADLPDFAPAEAAAPDDVTALEPGGFESAVTRDVVTGRLVHHRVTDGGEVRHNTHDGWTVAKSREERYEIDPDDPTSAQLDVAWRERFSRGAWEFTTKTRTRMRCTKTHFIVEADLEARMGDDTVAEKSWSFDVPRDLN